MSKGRVVLLRTPPVLPLSSVTAQQGVPSLGIAYLAAALKSENFLVTAIDALGEKIGTYKDFGVSGLLAAGLTIPEILARIPSDAFLIGVSCQFSNDWIFAKKILFALHEHFPKMQIVCGGEHTTADHEQILKDCPFVRACILGEGEETLCAIANALAEGRGLHEVASIAFLDDHQILRKNASRGRIKKIDQIPWPDWDSMPLENYLSAGLGMAAQGIRSMPILASRGCPFRCTFCSAPQMWEAKWYGRQIDDVINEAKSYIEKYRIEHLEFYDMSPSIQREWLETLTERLGELGISWNFPSGMRIENLTPALLEKMHQAGCYKMTFALETSAPHLIKQLKKNVNPLKMLGLIRTAVKVGLITKVNFIWGLPNQTKRDVLVDYLFLFKLAIIGLHDATCFAFVPYPGSADFVSLKNQGLIPTGEAYERFLAFNVYNNPLKMRSWSRNIKDWQLSVWTLGGMALFYSTQFLLRPWRFVQLFRRIRSEKPVTMLELALFALVKNFVVGRKRGAKTHAALTSGPEHELA